MWMTFWNNLSRPSFITHFIFVAAVSAVLQNYVSDGLENYRLNANISEPGGVEMETCFSTPTDMTVELPEMKLKAPGIIKYNGFPVEIHHVTTADGYILQLHRIPRRHNYHHHRATRSRKLPVLLMHGYMGSSVNWILPHAESALAYRLANLGYDVWMGNVRGTSYSLGSIQSKQRHTSHEYWDFSWHEMGVYDLPAMIDFVLAHTDAPRLHYTGHSMGCTIYFVCMSLRPEYNAKVDIMFALAPVVFLSNMRFFSLNLLAPFSYSLRNMYQYLGGGTAMPELIRKVMLTGLGGSCKSSTTLNCLLCANFYYWLFNSDGRQTNHTMLPIIKSHFPDSASTKALTHYLQNTVAGKFQQFDPRFAFPGGPTFYLDNILPAEYNLTRVTTPVVIFHADRDNMASPVDVAKLVRSLPNVRVVIKVCYPYFNHMDFLYGVDVNPLVYDKLIHILEQEGSIHHEHLDLACNRPLDKGKRKNPTSF